MQRQPRLWVGVFCFLIAGIWACGARGGTGDDPRTIDQKAADAIAATRYEAAAQYLQTFIDSSVGDARVDQARKRLRDCNMALAKAWAGEGREADAARLYLSLAEGSAVPAETKAAMTKQALGLVTNALTDAEQKHLCARALELRKDFGQLFPDKTSPVTEKDLEKLAADGLVSAAQDKWNMLVLPEVAKQFYPDREPAWDELAKKGHGESMLLGHFRALADFGWDGRFLGEYEAMPKDAPLRSNQAFCDLVEKVLVNRAESWVMQGNVPEATKAVAAAKEILVTESKIKALKAIEAKLAKMPAGAAKELSFPGPVKGRTQWQDSGTGFEGKDILLDVDSDISVKAGFVLTGGSIELHRAKLHLLGTAAQPVIFQNVKVTLQEASWLEAENAIFINCTFIQSGDTSAGQFATKWIFSGCMLDGCQFWHLGNLIGLKMESCAWVGGRMPERRPAAGDPAAFYNGEWNDVSNCLFLEAEVAPSTVWMTKQCDFVRCGLSASKTFDGRMPLAVALYVPEADPFGEGLVAKTVVAGKGDLRYAFSRKPSDVKVPALFWGLLPVEKASAEKQ